MQRMGSAVCHQMAERSFIFDGMQMPLCARCTGIYIGVFFAFCFLFLKKRMERGASFSAKEAALTAFAVLPVGVDGVGSYLGFWQSSQFLRILTGSMVGAVVPGFLLLAVNFDPKKKEALPVYEKGTELLLLMVLSVGFGLCLWAGLSFYVIGAVISVIGEVLLWGSLVWLVLKNLLKDRKIPYWRISMAAAVIGLFAIGGLVP